MRKAVALFRWNSFFARLTNGPTASRKPMAKKARNTGNARNFISYTPNLLCSICAGADSVPASMDLRAGTLGRKLSLKAIHLKDSGSTDEYTSRRIE
jgi:hypothetical protein